MFKNCYFHLRFKLCMWSALCMHVHTYRIILFNTKSPEKSLRQSERICTSHTATKTRAAGFLVIVRTRRQRKFLNFLNP